MSERGRIFMVKKVMACLLLVVLWSSCAWATWNLSGSSASIADMTDGKSDYSNARFFRFAIRLIDSEVPVTEEIAKVSGSLTISGGRYSFWNGREMQKVSGDTMTFPFTEVTNVRDGSVIFEMHDNNGDLVYLIPENETGLNGVNVSCHFPAMTSFDGAVNLGTFRTTQEQLNEYVPYIEYVRDGTKVTGLKYRLVVSSDTETALPAENYTNVFFNIWGTNWNFLTYTSEEEKHSEWHAFPPGDKVEGTVSFDEPVEESDIWAAEIWFTNDVMGNYNNKAYHWYFFDNKLTPNIYLWRPHDSQARFINGKSYYRGAKFAEVDMYIEAENIIAEAKYFTDEGTLTIPGGGYTVISDDETNEVSSKAVLDNIASGRDMTFGLRMNTNGTNRSYIGKTWAEYGPADDSGRDVAFAGGAETGLNGRNISWTFPADLSMDGSATLPNFKSTAEQLAGIVPYVEAVSSDGKLTALNYRLVASNDTSTAVTPSYRTDFRFYIESLDLETGGVIRLFRGNWVKDTHSGTFTFSEPIPMEQIYNVQVRLKSYEDSREPIYIWHFYTAEALEITTATLPDATQNAPYTATLAANLTGATWSISSGSLPAGLTLNPSTGAITGTPTTAGTSSFTVRAVKDSQSAEKQLTLTVSTTPTITITTASLNAGTVGTSYSATLSASIAGANWTLISGNLPDGLTLSTSGVISGTPTSAGTSTFTVRAAYSTATAEKQFTLTINDTVTPPVTTLTITTTSLNSGTTGRTYSATLSANISGATWSVVSGTLPAGLTLNASTGAITGTPTTAGEYTFTVRAVYGSQSAEKSFTITVTHSGTMGINNSSSSGCESGFAVCSLLVLAIFLKKR